MAMRTDCKHYESRSYGSETVRKCRLDAAPEAPWNCPPDCPLFAKRLVDVGWTYGSLAPGMGAAPPEPVVADDADIAALLDSAEDIVNAAGAELLAEMDAKQRKGMFRKKKRR